MSRRTYVLIPFSVFDPHTESDIDKLLGVNNEERTSFNPLLGRWDEMFRDSLGIERTTIVYTPKWEKDANGEYKRDENDKLIPVLVPKLDEDGNEILELKLDDYGLPVIVDGKEVYEKVYVQD